MNASVLFSVVVCTYNRAELLSNVLESLIAQDFPKEKYEILIIDNNSTDNTKTISEQFCKKNFNISYWVETEIGLSNARNKGYRVAKGQYVAYVDDDCKIPSHWLKKAEAIVSQIRPDIFGGPYYPFYNTPKPYWFKKSYATGIITNVPRLLKSGEYISGMNMVFSTEILRCFKGFNPYLGMTGNKIAYGEETHLQRKVRERKPEAKLYYHPDFYVFHLVRSEKMKLYWTIKRAFFGAKTTYKSLGRNYSDLNRTRIIVRMIYVFIILLKGVLIAMFNRDRRKYPLLQNYIYEKTTKYIMNIGYLAGLLLE